MIYPIHSHINHIFIFARVSSSIQIHLASSMLVTNFGDGKCWWEHWDLGDWFDMLMTDSLHWKSHQHDEKNYQHNDYVTNFIKMSPSLSHQHKAITNMIVAIHVIWPEEFRWIGLNRFDSAWTGIKTAVIRSNTICHNEKRFWIWQMVCR